MRKWTEPEALEYLLDGGAEIVSPRRILKENGWDGLKACSAMDYLKKLNYKFILRINPYKKSKRKPVSDLPVF